MQSTCPSHDVLRDFRLGKLRIEVIQEVSEHLETCPNCLADIETISDADDTLAHDLRQPPEADEFQNEPDLQKALAAVQALGAEITLPPGSPPDCGLRSTGAARESTKVDVESLGALRDYQLLEMLGEGGMGAVYKARHQRLKRTVALKVLPRDRTRDKRAVARFEREMEAVGKLDHPNIVRALDAGEHDGRHYLVMEFVDGLDISQLVKRRGPLPVADACELVRQAAAGLQSAHEHGLVHRDIKPSNLMLTAAGQVKMLDLGLALLMSDQPGGEELTGASQMMGTADYCAPEQVGDSHKVDIRADIYSLGCTLYKLLTGHAPFSGQRFDTTMKKLMAHTTQSVPPVRELRPDVPDGLAKVVDRMLAKQPAERYATPAEVMTAITPFALESDLNQLLAQVSKSRPPSPDPLTMSETTPHLSSALTGTRTGPAPPPAPAGAHGPTESSSGGRRPRRRLFIAAAAAAAALLAGVLIVIKNREGKIVATVQTNDRADVKLADSEHTAEIRPTDENDAASGTRERPGKSVSAPNGEPAEKVAGGTASTGRLTPPARQTLERPTAPQNAAWPADAPSPAIAPFDEDQARQHQQAWADYLKLPLEYTNSVGMKFILIPPGEFMMGSTPEEIEQALKVAGDNNDWREAIKRGEAPQHKVVLTRPFYLGVHEVTQKEYEAVMGVNPSFFTKTNPDEMVVKQVADLDTGNHPVETVSWNDAAEFCAKLSRQEEFKPFYFRVYETVTPLKGTGYRLPTEAEWEFACRAGTATRFWIGDNEQDLVDAGWFGVNAGGRTHEVGELASNPFGLFDVHGNVAEWVEDTWQPAIYGPLAETAVIDPRFPLSAGPHRVFRNAGWGTLASAYCRSARRDPEHMSHRQYAVGFRVVSMAVSPRASQRVGTVDDGESRTEHTGKLTPPARQDLARPSVPENAAWPSDAPAPAIAPFHEQQAREHQEAWADYLKLPLEFTNSVGMKFILIPPGEFMMGSTPEETEQALKDAGEEKQWQEHIKSEAPQHNVVLTRPFYLGMHEVTQKEYQAVMGVNPSHFAKTNPDKTVVTQVADLDTWNHPVETVTWNDAAEFCARLSKQEELKPFYFRAGEFVTPLKGTGYRLPTEAEWEFACRAGKATKFWIGDKEQDLLGAGWFGGNAGGRTHEVEELPSNPFGLFDVHGNVWEWVEDSWAATFYEKVEGKTAIDPKCRFAADSQRVTRGGAGSDYASRCRSAHRDAHDRSYRYDNVGFRVVLVAVSPSASR